VERQSAKHRKGKQPASVKRPRPQSSWPDQRAGASAQETAPGANSMLVRPRPPRMISGPPGPCWRCGAYGHLAASCAASGKPYPLSKCVSSGNDEVSGPHMAQGSKSVNQVVAESTTGDNCVDGSSENVNLVVAQSNMGDDCVDGSPENNGLASSNGEDIQSPRDMGMEGTLMQYWEVEQGLSKQITDVQGRLRQNLSFWREALQAPSPILDCIEHGYHLPLKHVPHFLYSPQP